MEHSALNFKFKKMSFVISRISIIQVLCVFIILYKVNGDFGPCKTPHGFNGSCLTLPRCKPLHDLAIKDGISQNEINYLRSSQCGSINGKPLVCCTTELNTDDETPTTLKPVDRGFVDEDFMDSSCQTYNGAPGDCMALPSCLSTLEIVTESKYKAVEYNMVSNNNCGIANNVRYVCCRKMRHMNAAYEPPKSIQIVDSACQTPNGLPGICKSINGCSNLRNLVLANRTPYETNFLAKSQCGIVNRNFMVCCPAYAIEFIPEPETTAIRYTTLPTHPPPIACQTPNGIDGECTALEECDSLNSLAQRESKTKEEELFLRRSECKEEDFLVCCPKTLGSIYIQHTTPKTVEHCRMPDGSLGELRMKRLDFFRWRLWCRIDQKAEDSKERGMLPTSNECGRFSLKGAISGGAATDIDEYPWTALLLYKNVTDDTSEFAQCSGSLINHYYVLTAAHCIYDKVSDGLELSRVRLGEWNIDSDVDCGIDNKGETFCSDDPIDIKVADIIIHKKYKKSTVANDIALLRLEERVEYTNFISPICLPLNTMRQFNNYDNQLAFVTGWADANGVVQSMKLTSRVKIRNLAQCRDVDLNGELELTKNQICALSYLGGDTCHGDSGGPLMFPMSQNDRISYYQIGITSFGSLNECGNPHSRGIYTSVEAYMGWIKHHLNN